MKFIGLGIIFILILLICILWFLSTRPSLIATRTEDDDFTFLVNLNSEEKQEIANIYHLIQHELPNTLKRRIELRRWTSSEMLLTTTYVVRDKQQLYFFTDNYPWKAPTLEAPSTRFTNSIRCDLKSKSFEVLTVPQ